MGDKNARVQFGASGTPTKAKRAFVRAMAFDHPEVKAQSWVLITPQDQRVHLNSYDGKLGKGVDPAQFTHPLPEGGIDGKEMAKKLRLGKADGYREVPVTDCPFAEPVGVESANADAPIAPAADATTPIADAPAADAPIADAPIADAPAADAPTTPRRNRNK